MCSSLKNPYTLFALYFTCVNRATTRKTEKRPLFDSPFLHSALPLRCLTCQHSGSAIFGAFPRLCHVCAQHAFARLLGNWEPRRAAHEFKSRFTGSQLPLRSELKYTLGSGCKLLASVRVRCGKGGGLVNFAAYS